MFVEARRKDPIGASGIKEELIATYAHSGGRGIKKCTSRTCKGVRIVGCDLVAIFLLLESYRS
jgi:hypothetical protein